MGLFLCQRIVDSLEGRATNAQLTRSVARSANFDGEPRVTQIWHTARNVDTTAEIAGQVLIFSDALSSIVN